MTMSGSWKRSLGRGRLQVEDPERQGGIAPHHVVQLGDGHELRFLGADEGIPAFRQLHLGTQHVVGVRHPSLETGSCVLQSRLRLPDGLLLHEELHFGLHIAVGPWGAAGHEKSCRTRGSRPLIIRGGPGLGQEVKLR
jgi:hypothetical protein